MKIIHRKQRSILNISLSLISQIIAVLAGMLLPRVLMTHYGSETNGMVSSIQQAVGYLTLIEGGLLSTVAVKLYKPLADGDTERGYEYLLPHLYRAIVRDGAPHEKQIAIG